MDNEWGDLSPEQRDALADSMAYTNPGADPAKIWNAKTPEVRAHALRLNAYEAKLNIAARREAERAADPETQAAWDKVHPEGDPLAYMGRVRLSELFDREWDEHETLLHPLVTPGRQTALFARAGQGKSLLVFEGALQAATGQPTFGTGPVQEPKKIMYVDREMTPVDVENRAESMGYNTPELRALTDEYLYYAQFPSFGFLDQPVGSERFLMAVDDWKPELIIFDTLSRMVCGQENESSTIIDFMNYTGQELKRRGIAYIRIDHMGKGTQGVSARGSSAKDDDVDTTFKLEVSEVNPSIITLNRGKNRGGDVAETYTFTKKLDPTRHVLDAEPFIPGDHEIIAAIRRYGVDPLTSSGRKAKKAIEDAGGPRFRRDRVGKMLEHMKQEVFNTQYGIGSQTQGATPLGKLAPKTWEPPGSQFSANGEKPGEST